MLVIVQLSPGALHASTLIYRRFKVRIRPVLGGITAGCPRPLCRVSEPSASPAKLHKHLVLDAASAALRRSHKITLAEHLMRELNRRPSRLICLGLGQKQVSACSMQATELYSTYLRRVGYHGAPWCFIPPFSVQTNLKHSKALSEWSPHGRFSAAAIGTACSSVGLAGQHEALDI